MSGGADRYAGPNSISASTRADPHTVSVTSGMHTHARHTFLLSLVIVY